MRSVSVLLACLAPLLGACSLGLPSLGDTDEPEEVTGSIARRAEPPRFARELTPEDLRRLRGALALALDPQGNGRRVAWDNPESGHRGEIDPAGSPYVEADEICRRFTAGTTVASGRKARLSGHACRIGGDDWEVRALRPG